MTRTMLWLALGALAASSAWAQPADPPKPKPSPATHRRRPTPPPPTSATPATPILTLPPAAPPPAGATSDMLPWSTCAARFAPVGAPVRLAEGADLPQVLICRTADAVAYDPVTRTPLWSMERLTVAQLQGSAKRSNKFLHDPATDPDGPTNADYTNSGFDRGHQAPAADAKYSQAVMDQTFYFSNMAPQVGLGLNRGVWAKLEDLVRSWVLCDGRQPLFVITGPIFEGSAQAINKRVRVPSAFFKVAYDGSSGRVTAIVFDNKAYPTLDPTSGTPTSITDLERRTGLSFLPSLPARQKAVLASNVQPLWGRHVGDCTVPAG